jgi:hypothetical protein
MKKTMEDRSFMEMEFGYAEKTGGFRRCDAHGGGSLTSAVAPSLSGSFCREADKGLSRM